MDSLKRDILICECNSLEHQLTIWRDKEDGSIYFEIHLTTGRNFFKRLLYGLKYAFGHKSRFGAWEEFVLKEEDKEKIKKLL